MTDVANAKKAEGRVLLPLTIVPTRYDLKITPDLEKFTFTGEVKITLSTTPDLGDNCREIILHAKELCFSSASYLVEGTGENKEAEEVSGA